MRIDDKPAEHPQAHRDGSVTPQPLSWQANVQRGTPPVAESAGRVDAAGDAGPNGPPVAALLATGISCAVMGLGVVLASAVSAVRGPLTTVWPPAGPLPGLALVATVSLLASWAGLHWWLRRRTVGVAWVRITTTVLIGVGLLGTFPPFYNLFR